MRQHAVRRARSRRVLQSNADLFEKAKKKEKEREKERKERKGNFIYFKYFLSYCKFVDSKANFSMAFTIKEKRIRKKMKF